MVAVLRELLIEDHKRPMGKRIVFRPDHGQKMIGDLGHLGTLAEWANAQGAAWIVLGPTAATSLFTPRPASPYSASSRLFQDVTLIDIGQVAGHELLPESGAYDPLVDTELLDLDEIRIRKLRALTGLFRLRRESDREALDEFRREMGDDLAWFATFEAAERRYGVRRNWPPELLDGGGSAAARWAAAHREEIEFFEWCQWVFDVQLRAVAAKGPGIVRDLPVGVTPNGADAWRWHEAVSPAHELGAPPDYFNPEGHAWGLVPFDPDPLRAVGFEPIRKAVRATLRHAAGLRIDHAFGLFRQYWIPRGNAAADGRYVAQYAVPLLDIICIEAYRAGAFVISEELGTPPPSGVAELRERGFVPLEVLMSDEFGIGGRGAAAVTTHDLPTFVGCWTGLDEQLLADAGVQVDRDFASRARRRLREYAGVDESASTLTAAAETLRTLAASDHPVVIVALDDLLQVGERPNVPGVSESLWPSFRRRLPPIEDLGRESSVQLIESVGSRR